MMRKIFAMLFCLVLVSLVVTPALASAQLPRIVDDADLLSAEEEAQLEEMAVSFREENQLDAVVLTVNSLEGKNIASYAEDYYDYSGYGVGTDKSGLILVVAMEERELYISTCGEAIQRLNDDELDTIISGTSYWLSEGDYYDAFDAFYGLTPLYLDINTDYGSTSNNADTALEVNWLLSILSGAVTAGIVVFIMAGFMNTKRKQHSAGDYLTQGSYDLKNRQDIFLYSSVSKVKREQNNSSSRTSVRTGSSGRSHGGRGGKF